MSLKNESNDVFLNEVASLFEENCLHDISSEKEIDACLLFVIDYCLDNRKWA